MTHKTLIQHYHTKCQQEGLIEDQGQLDIVAHLASLSDDLTKASRKEGSLFACLRRKHPPIKGAYLWGGVGIGKTFLMDLFFEQLPFAQKKRMHFHAFMQWVHKALKEREGNKNPLEEIAKELRKNILLLCFDELTVTDITDAMILGKLFKALFEVGVTLVVTSNAMPDELYKNGLQRKLFLPTIELIKAHTKVMHLATTVDYRLRHLQEAGVFHMPNNALAQQKMEKSFAVFSQGEEVQFESIKVYDRLIKVYKKTEKVVWFDFYDICSVPRSQLDFLFLAKEFHTIFISNVPAISADAKDKIALFIRMIDVFYDAGVRL